MDKISALMDGELDEHEAREQLARLKQDEDLARCWQTFHLIGDAMRGERALSQDFEQRFSAAAGRRAHGACAAAQRRQARSRLRPVRRCLAVRGRPGRVARFRQ